MKHAYRSAVGRLQIMKRLLLLALMASVGLGAYAQSPVEDLVDKYKKYSGKLIILHLSSASRSVQESFEKSLYSTLGAYNRFGVHSSSHGPVQVYAKFSGSNTVTELVIFNPTLYVLNDIHGDFSVNSLKKLK